MNRSWGCVVLRVPPFVGIFPMSHHYLNAVHQGKNEWWRYLVGILTILGFGLVMGSLLAGVVAVVLLPLVDPEMTQPIDPLQLQAKLFAIANEPSVLNFVIQNMPFLALMIGIIITVKLVHGRPFRSLFSATNQFSLKRFFTGYGLWMVMLMLLSVLSYWRYPQDIVWNFQPQAWGLLLLASLLLTPLQIGAEELFCRGYLMQGLGLLTRNKLLLVSLPSVLFALAHFSNPEMARGAVWMALQYWCLGVFLAFITLRDNRLELALGIHAAQNMFVLLFANTADSVLKTPSIWQVTDPGDPRLSLVWLLVQSGVFYWILFGHRSKPAVSE